MPSHRPILTLKKKPAPFVPLPAERFPARFYRDWIFCPVVACPVILHAEAVARPLRQGVLCEGAPAKMVWKIANFDNRPTRRAFEWLMECPERRELPSPSQPMELRWEEYLDRWSSEFPHKEAVPRIVYKHTLGMKITKKGKRPWPTLAQQGLNQRT